MFGRRNKRVEPGPGQESVWDYPRPPRVEPTPAHVVVELGGAVIAETRRALRVLETSHPPAYYLPFSDVADGVLEEIPVQRTYCEFKGAARYWAVTGGDTTMRGAAWDYPEPASGYEELRDHVAFHPRLMERCTVDGEVATSQQGDFYGGWITSRVVGPFKGGEGTRGW